MANLQYDHASILSSLASLPMVATDFGLRPHVRKADLILAIAPVYIEFGKFMRALLNSRGIHRPIHYLNPLPVPIFDPHPDIVGLPCDWPRQFSIDLATGTITNEVPSGPSISIAVDYNAMSMTEAVQYPDDLLLKWSDDPLATSTTE